MNTVNGVGPSCPINFVDPLDIVPLRHLLVELLSVYCLISLVLLRFSSVVMATPNAAVGPRAERAESEADPLYICQSCLSEQVLPRDGGIVCKQCAHPTGTSKVFFKKRVQPTEYKAM